MVANENDLASIRRATFASGATDDSIYRCTELAFNPRHVADHQRHGTRWTNDEESVGTVTCFGCRLCHSIRNSLS